MKRLTKSSEKTIAEKFSLPPVGQRMVRSAVGVLLCLLVYYLSGERGTPFYSAIALLQCIQPDNRSTAKMAVQRGVGTIVGAIFGLATLIIQGLVPQDYTDIRYFITPLFIIPVIYFTLLIKQQSASYFSCVVFLSITIAHTSDAEPLIFVMNRALDTFIGIFIAIIVNSAHLPRKQQRDTLFVVKLDDALSHHKENLTPYSKVELNRIIDDGAKLVIATMRTPASLMEPMTGVKLSLPIIAMDGAALYDVSSNSFDHAYVISHKTAQEICAIADSLGLHCFVNALADNTLMIYYGDFVNKAEELLFKKLSRSPYRCYVKRSFTRQDMVIYVMCLDAHERIKAFYDRLEAGGYAGRLKIDRYRSIEYEGMSYIKIYNKNASLENMLYYLKEDLNVGNVCTIGTEDSCDVTVMQTELNAVVKTLKNTYEPCVIDSGRFRKRINRR